jgi:hypothetical protein
MNSAKSDKRYLTSGSEIEVLLAKGRAYHIWRVRMAQKGLKSSTPKPGFSSVSASEKRSHSGRCWSGPVIHQNPLARTQYELLNKFLKFCTLLAV